MIEIFPNLVKDLHLQIQEPQWTPKLDKPKEIHVQKYNNQTAKNKRQKSLKQP